MDDLPPAPAPGAEELHAAYQHLLSRRDPSYLSELALQLLHKFNNRITGVLFHVDQAGNPGDDSRSQRLETIRTTLLDSLSLINTLGRLFAQDSVSERTYYSLERVVNNVLPLLELLLPKGAPIHFQPPAEPVCFYGNTNAVEEILLHLAFNAGAALPEAGGELWLEIDADPAEQPGAQSRVVMRDNGPGIDEEILPRLFTPLATTRRALGHAGLGLHRARSLARALGGDLTGDNGQPSGAEFCLCLPQADPEAAA